MGVGEVGGGAGILMAFIIWGGLFLRAWTIWLPLTFFAYYRGKVKWKYLLIGYVLCKAIDILFLLLFVSPGEVKINVFVTGLIQVLVGGVIMQIYSKYYLKEQNS